MLKACRLIGSFRNYNSLSKKGSPYLSKRYQPKKVMSLKIKDPLIWIDCEMTGLDHANDHVIEICCIITDGNLNVVKDPETGEDNLYESVIHYDSETMSKMNEWCINQHGISGLTRKVLASNKTLPKVQKEVQDYLLKYIPEPRTGLLAGNSVHIDRLFLLKEFPKLVEHLHYRIIDVSTVMEICKRHNNKLQSVIPPKVTAHTAKSDILESIEQLRWYQQHYLKSPSETHEFVETLANTKSTDAAADADAGASIRSNDKKRKLTNK